jgi:hypothetical protein
MLQHPGYTVNQKMFPVPAQQPMQTLDTLEALLHTPPNRAWACCCVCPHSMPGCGYTQMRPSG